MKKDNVQKKLIMLFVGAFLIMIFMMIFSYKVDAAPLPYQVYNENFDFHGMTVQDVENYLNQHIQVNWDFDFDIYPTIMYTYEDNNNDYLIIFTGYPSSSPSTYFFDLNNVPYSFFDTDINYCTFTYTNICKIQLRYPYSVNYVYDWTWWPYQTQNLTFFGNYYFPEYISENLTLASGAYDENTNPYVLQIYEEPLIIPTGHATQPTNNPNNIINGLDGHKIPKPNKPTINNYSWTTYNNPPIDTTNAETILQSIFNALSYNFTYLFSNLGGLFSNLIDNIGNLFDFVVNSIYYAVNNIVSAIQDFAMDFYNNMVSLFEPIAENIKNLREKIEEAAEPFINPYDEELLEQQMNDCKLITRYNELLDNCEVIQQIFDETSEPDSFILYIDFENPFADSEHKIIKSEINFNWLVPLRPVYRPFLSVFTLIECFVGGFQILGNIIGGKAK